MAKRYKIKRYMRGADTSKARPHPLFIIMMLVLAGGLVYVGVILYNPIYNMIMESVNRPPASTDEDSTTYDEEGEEDEAAAATAQKPQLATGLKAAYASQSLVANQAAFDSLLDELPGNVNSVMIDIKDRNGQVLFRSTNQNANDWEAIAPGAEDLSAINQKLKDKGLSLIVRMSTFRDDTAARGNVEIAVCYRSAGTRWLDNFPTAGGKAWLNPYSAGAQEYITSLALEAVAMGAVLVVFDDFNFPPTSLSADAFFGAESAGISRDKCLADFAAVLDETLAEQGARAAIYLNVSAIASPVNMTLYNAPAEKILGSAVVLGALPNQFPADGFYSENLTIQRPLDDPADTVRQAVGFALGRLGGKDTIVLALGGSETNAANYSPQQLKAQLDVLEDLGIEEYILYVSDSRYTVGDS